MLWGVFPLLFVANGVSLEGSRADQTKVQWTTRTVTTMLSHAVRV
jgi:hypothetical protein